MQVYASAEALFSQLSEELKKYQDWLVLGTVDLDEFVDSNLTEVSYCPGYYNARGTYMYLASGKVLLSLTHTAAKGFRRKQCCNERTLVCENIGEWFKMDLIWSYSCSGSNRNSGTTTFSITTVLASREMMDKRV